MTRVRTAPARIAVAATLAAALCLSGCTTWRTAAQPQAVVEPNDDTIDMHGRFSMRYTSTQGLERHEYVTGTFTLHHDRTATSLELVSPFGQTVARAGQTAGRAATLETADGRLFTGADLDSVFQQAIGMRIPASRLPQWLSGHFEHVLARGDSPPSVRAVDSGWTVERRDRRWDLQRVAPNERIDVRLVTDRE